MIIVPGVKKTTVQTAGAALVLFAVLMLAAAVLTGVTADKATRQSTADPAATGKDGKTGVRPPITATPPAHPTAGKRNGKLLPYCAYEVAAIIEGPPHEWYPTLTYVTGLNEKGAVCGHWSWIGPDKPFYWTAETGLVTLDLPPGFNEGMARDINDHMVMVGSMTGPGLPWRGFVYDIPSDTWTILEPVDPDGSSSSCWANAINNDGIVVGARSIGDTQQPYNAFIWTPGPPEEPGGGTYEDLGVMNGPNSTARDISEAGVTVGWTGSSSVHPDTRGFVFTDGVLQILDEVPDGLSSAVNGTNAIGVLAGFGRMNLQPPSVLLGAVWNEEDILSIDRIPGYHTSAAGDINNYNHVVGLCSNHNKSNDHRAYLWINEITIDLNELLENSNNVLLRTGRGINDASQIIANGSYGSTPVGFLLNPIPRPLGDLTSNCEVGTDDLVIFLQEWGKRQSPADFNGDGLVDGADLGILLSNWSQ